jgi:UDP-N-acetylglucosamine transferase subunit ALG13
MIFVTVGTHEQSFDRLVKAVDDLVGENKIEERVVLQIGNTKYEPKNCEWFRFLPSQKQILNYIKKADIVITHGGAGSIITALKFYKPTIVVPRYKKFNEHTNDHQLDLAGALAKEGKIMVVYDINDLEIVIKKAKAFRVKVKNEKIKMIKIIKNYLIKLSYNFL